MPTPPGYAEISLRFKHGSINRPAFITFGVDPAATDGLVICDHVANAWATGSGPLQLQDSEVTMNQVRCSLGTDGTEDIVTLKNYTHAGIGSASSSVPANCAVLVHKITARGGRRGKGRFYLPWFISETSVDEAGGISGGLVTTLQAAMTAFLTALTSQTVPMVLLHRPSEPWDPVKETGVEHPTTAGPPNVVTNLLVDGIIGTQRRRLGR